MKVPTLDETVATLDELALRLMSDAIKARLNHDEVAADESMEALKRTEDERDRVLARPGEKRWQRARASLPSTQVNRLGVDFAPSSVVE